MSLIAHLYDTKGATRLLLSIQSKLNCSISSNSNFIMCVKTLFLIVTFVALVQCHEQSNEQNDTSTKLKHRQYELITNSTEDINSDNKFHLNSDQETKSVKSNTKISKKWIVFWVLGGMLLITLALLMALYKSTKREDVQELADKLIPDKIQERDEAISGGRATIIEL